MKILMVTSVSYTVMLFRKELIQYLLKKGNEVVVVSGDSERKEDIEALGTEFYNIPIDNKSLNPFKSIAYKNKLTKLIRKLQPDTVMTFQAKPNTFGAIAAKKAKVENIHCMVEGLGSGFSQEGLKGKLLKTVSKLIYKKAFKKVKTVFFLNQSNMDYMINNKIATKEQSCLLNGIGVDLNEFSPKEMPSLETVKFVMVARLFKEKGVLEYCKACKILKERGVKDLNVSLYGDAGDVDKIVMQDYVKNGYLEFGGFVKDIRPVLAQNHVVVLSSYHEGMSRSLMESVAMGKVIIASDIDGCREAVNDNYNGFRIPVKNPIELADKMEYLVNNKNLIAEMGNNSRLLCEEKFDCSKINEVILSVL